jgi:hypothetical protein
VGQERRAIVGTSIECPGATETVAEVEAPAKAALRTEFESTRAQQEAPQTVAVVDESDWNWGSTVAGGLDSTSADQGHTEREAVIATGPTQQDESAAREPVVGWGWWHCCGPYDREIPETTVRL